MSIEPGNTAPEALNLGFVARVSEHVTKWQFNRLTANLDREGVTEFLGPEAAEAPFDTYMKLVDTIERADAIEDPDNSPGHASLAVHFTHQEGRDRFHRLVDLSLAGIHGPTMPAIRPGLNNELLYLRNFSYPDLSALGRIGTALLIKQYDTDLGRNRRLTLNQTLSEMEDNGVMDYLPRQLLSRIAYLKEKFGEKAGDIILTSGHLSLLGSALRDELDSEENPLPVQRPRGYRPAIEEDASFYVIRSVKATGAPVSGSGLGRAVAGQLTDRAEDLMEPFKKRKLAKAGEDSWSIMTGLGITEGIFSAVRVIGTIAVAAGAALWSKRIDNKEKHRRGLKLIFY